MKELILVARDIPKDASEPIREFSFKLRGEALRDSQPQIGDILAKKANELFGRLRKEIKQ